MLLYSSLCHGRALLRDHFDEILLRLGCDLTLVLLALNLPWIVQGICVSHEVLIACGSSTLAWPSRHSNALQNHVYFLNELRKDFQTSNNQKLTLGYVLVTTNHQKATDSRDRVYGVLGLVSAECGINIVPDYSKSPCSVFCEAFRTIYKESQHYTKDIKLQTTCQGR